MVRPPREEVKWKLLKMIFTKSLVGGGGSGGTILLSSGGVTVNEGILDASGGAGGYGGPNSSLAGGGGGGGRITVYAESFINLGAMGADGGPCGLLTIPYVEASFSLEIVLSLASPYALDPSRFFYIAEYFMNRTISNIYSVNSSMITFDYINDSYVIKVRTDLIFDAGMNISVIIQNISNSTLAASPFTLADVSITEISMENFYYLNNTFISNTFAGCINVGNPGTVTPITRMQTGMRVEGTTAAEGTSFALHLFANDTVNSPSNTTEEIPLTWNGPIVSFNKSQPSRFTYYTKTDSIADVSTQSGFGSLVSLISLCDMCDTNSSIIGVYFGKRFMYGSNFEFSVDDHYYENNMITLDYYSELDQWYKVDIHIDWTELQYYILLNDVLIVSNVSFTANYINGVRFSTFLTTHVWFDEIYVGFDPTMRFTCPVSFSDHVGVQGAPQYNWKVEEVIQQGTNGLPQFDLMSRHYSFYLPKNTLPFDGQGNLNFFQDYQYHYPAVHSPQLHTGALLYLTNTPRSAQIPSSISATTVSSRGWWTTGSHQTSYGRQFWYVEYDFSSDLSPSLNGGVCACSSQDLLNWRFEGIVFHYANLSDMVFGSAGPFHVERPKVLQNNMTEDFVLWAGMDNMGRSLAMAVILSSPFEDGPFYYRRSFYPDGNQTRDQVISWSTKGVAVLSRTYYQTVEFVLPEAMMQPVWESVKLQNGATNFRNSYHRTNYEIGYDNYHDIFLQRWRKENKPWEVFCVNKISGLNRSVPLGTYNSDGSICHDPEEYKVVIGQGDPYVQSNYVDPRNPENSWWRQSSVPAVQAQPWSNNVLDGLCGLQQYNDGISEYDPNLVDFTPQNRSNCSNIADNPLQPSIPDKLIGIQRVVSRRRAKYVASSRLTFDLLDTTGWLSSIEGELESADLISLVDGMSEFGISPGEEILATFEAPIMSEFATSLDYKIRFRQYIRQYNDRAYYSLACVIDGVCPVNYKDQLKS